MPKNLNLADLKNAVAGSAAAFQYRTVFSFPID